MYKIQGFDSGVPSLFMAKRSYCGRPRKYPFSELKIGQWFFVPQEDASINSLRQAVYKLNDDYVRLKVKRVEGGCEVHRIY